MLPMETAPTHIFEHRPGAALTAAIRTREILGIPMAMTDYSGAMDVMDAMVDRHERGWVCAAAVHSVMVAQDDPGMRTALTDSVITVPDGMPVVWAANLLGENLPNRVYGPELMQRYCARSAERGLRVWLYGGRDQGALVQLALTLRQKHPGIKIVGGYSPPFRSLSSEEDDNIAEQINRDRPDVIWVGIGVPKQEKWMVRMRDRLDAPVMCAVGRGVRLQRRPRVPGAPLDAGARAWSGPTGSPRSRAGCSRATSTPTRASCTAWRASTSGNRPPPGLDSAAWDRAPPAAANCRPGSTVPSGEPADPRRFDCCAAASAPPP